MKRFATLLTLIVGLLGTSFLATAPAALACSSGQVQLSVPVLSGQSCVDGSKPGGVIVAYVTMLVKLLSGLVGAVIVLMLVIAGIQYITSAGDPGAIKNAKGRITNAITALILFIFMFAILNFIIPGGILT